MDQEALEGAIEAVAEVNANRYIPDPLHKYGANSVLPKGSPDTSKSLLDSPLLMN